MASLRGSRREGVVPAGRSLTWSGNPGVPHNTLVPMRNWITARAPEAALLAIDAPILAPNPPGTAREADRLTTRLFGRYHAGVYPANRKVCARPIRLSRKLARLGFSPDPWLAPGERVRRQLEFYPHSSLVALLSLPRIIKYKKGPVASRCRGLLLLQKALAKLARLDPSLAPSVALRALLSTPPSRLAGRSLKRLEDELDAAFLAYLAAYYWRWGLARSAVLGDLRSGYILSVLLDPGKDRRAKSRQVLNVVTFGTPS